MRNRPTVRSALTAWLALPLIAGCEGPPPAATTATTATTPTTTAAALLPGSGTGLIGTAVDCGTVDSQKLGKGQDGGPKNTKRPLKFQGNKNHDHGLYVVHTGNTDVTIEEISSGTKRGMEVNVAGDVPEDSAWAFVVLDAKGCVIAEPETVGLSKDGEMVAGSHYNPFTETVSGYVVGNSAYVIATPGGPFDDPTADSR